MPANKKKKRAAKKALSQQQRRDMTETAALALEAFGDDSPAARQAHYEKMNEKNIAAGLDPFVDAPPDGFRAALPSCDVCGAENAPHKCARCESAHYCSAACQRMHWKEGGHKAACKTLRESVRATALAVTTQMRERCADAVPDDPEEVAAAVQGLDRLDREAAYLAALEHGNLNDVLMGLIRQDAEQVRARHRAGIMCCWLEHTVTTLFRGQRRSRAGHPSFGKADGGRCAAFVLSHADAWHTWLDAAAAIASLITDPIVSRDPKGSACAHRSARNCWTFLTMALARSSCARAIVLFQGDAGARACANANADPKSSAGVASAGADTGAAGGGGEGRTAEAARQEFAQWRAAATARSLKTVLDTLDSATETQDHNSVVEANANQVAAMLAIWVEKLLGEEAGERFTSTLRLRGKRRKMYDTLAVPLAAGTIEKKRTLTNEEAREYIARAGGMV